jgi:uncharacterized protein (TIGR03790 family)
LVIASCLVVRADAALQPSNVLVLYNADDAESSAIASYYAQKRPGVRLLGLNGVTTAEEVTANYYLSAIRPQILPALDNSTDVIVTTKGLPLRIRIEQANPRSYTDPSGQARSIGNWYWKRYSSLESELTRIDTISTWQQMGDQTTNLTPNPILALNPYYWESTDFSHQHTGIRLTSRLDGFTVADVRGMIDRSAKAFIGVGGTANNPFHVVVDDDPNAAGSFADNMERLHEFVLQPRGMPHTYDASDAFVQSPALSNPDSSLVIGYVSHGIHGGSPPSYLSDPVAGIHFQLANGAVFASWESFNAQTFEDGTDQNQGLVAEWIARGGTAGVGHVAEPLASSINVAREDCLFDRLLSGMSWVEAAWSANYQLSYVNTVVGDPLMRFKTWIPGDVTLDGVVDTNDVTLIQQSWLKPGGFHHGDLNGDGFIDTGDFNVVQQNWLLSSTGIVKSTGYRPAVTIDPHSGFPVVYYVPEPSTWLLVAVGCYLAGFRRGHRHPLL